MNDKQMPREKLVSKGVKSLTDEELIAIMIGSGTKNKNVFAIANDILKKYDIIDLKNLTYKKLLQIEGVNKAKACIFMACFEIARRASKIKQAISLTNANEIYKYIFDEIYLESAEVVIVIFLDCKLKPIIKKIYTDDCTFSVSFPLKKIIYDAIDYKSYGIVLVHNHPSGDTKPSEEDIELTFSIAEMLKKLNIILLDHLVVCPENYYSFNDNGLLSLFDEYD